MFKPRDAGRLGRRHHPVSVDEACRDGLLGYETLGAGPLGGHHDHVRVELHREHAVHDVQALVFVHLLGAAVDARAEPPARKLQVLWVRVGDGHDLCVRQKGKSTGVLGALPPWSSLNDAALVN